MKNIETTTDVKLGKILSTLEPYTYRHNKNMFTFTLFQKRCILIPFPHKDMNYTFLFEYQYRSVDYQFSLYGGAETMINFFGTEEYNRGNLYNVFLEGYHTVVPLSKIGELTFCKTPNDNFTYLVAIPL